MKKLGILLLILGLTVVNRWVLVYIPQFADLAKEPASYSLLVGLQAACLFAGGILFLLPLVWKRQPSFLPVAGLLLAIAVGFGVHHLAMQRRMPDVVMQLKVRWDGSYLYQYTDEYLDGLSTYIMDLDEKKKGPLAVKLHLVMGDHMLRMGRVPEAIKHYQRAYDISQRHPKAKKMLPDAARGLGIAWLRTGEIASCLEQPNAESCIFPLAGTGIWSRTENAEKAAELFNEVLKLTPNDPGARWLLALATGVSGTYPSAVAVDRQLPPWVVDGEAEAPHFHNSAVALGIAEDNLAGSVVMEDFDGDGFMDIITCSYAPDAPLRYHHNNGDGTFSEWNERAGIADQFGGLNLTMADYNNDGRMDLLVLRGAWFMSAGYQRNSLLRQEQDGTFTDVTEEAGLAKVDYPCLAAAWADYDLDGDLDVYIGNERLGAKVERARGGGYAPSELFRNNGDGTFTDVALEAGVDNLLHARGVAWGDYDNDGYPDLSVSNLLSKNRIYHNNGDGTFTDLVAQEGMDFMARPRRAFGSMWLDVNNDGWLDLFVATYPLTDRVDDVMNDRFQGERGDNVEPCALFLNDGQGGFTNVTSEWGMDRVHLVMGANLGDIDNDGWVDLYFGTGAPAFEIMIPNVLYRNIGGQGFADATSASGLGHLHKGHGISIGDLDNDGDLDIYAQLGGWYIDSHSQNAAFLNEGTSNHSLRVNLVGTTANRFGLGARLTAVVDDGEGGEREIHTVVGGTGSFGGNPMQQLIGLGGATTVKELRVSWPNQARTVQILKNLPVDVRIRITEGVEGYEQVKEQKLDFLPAGQGR